MSSNMLKIMALVTLIIAILLGFVAYKMSDQLTSARPAPEVIETSETKKLAYTMAVVAIKPLQAYQEIESGHVELVPVSVLPPEYFENKDEVIGKHALVNVEPGTTLTPRLFGQTSSLTESIPDGHRAMSLEIDDVIAVGGFVQPGNIVDALIYIQSKSKEVNDSQARLLLGEAMVLAYEERIVAEPVVDAEAREQAQSTRQRRQRTVVLSVPEDETLRVMLGASIGKIRLALHGPEREATEEEAATQVASNATAKDEASKQEAIKPITLRELSEIKKRRSRATRAAPAIAVYRGNDVETVRR